MRTWSVFAILVSWSITLCTGAIAADGWRVGVAKRAITPPQPMWMAGYASRDRPAESKATELWAKAVVLEDASDRRAVLVTLDLVGIGRDLALPLRKRIAEKLKLNLADVMLATSHTHSGPVVAKNLGPMHYLLVDEEQRRRIDEYAQFLEKSVLEAVDEAAGRLAPASLTFSSGTCDVAVNRRNNPEADVPQLREAGMLRGPSDHDVPVLAIRGDDGKLLAVVFGYACHATVLSGFEWSGDYPGYAQMAIEEKHPTAIALFWAGCGGDQNPIPRRKQELAEKYGRQLAKAVNETLEGEMKPVAPSLSTNYGEVDLAFASPPTRDELVAQTSDTNRYIAARAKHLLAELDAGRSVPGSYPYPIAVWKLGNEIDWVFLGGEVVVDYALRLKDERQGTRTWVAAYSNDVMAYIPSRRVLAEGGYEGGGAMIYYGQPSPWSEDVERTIVDAVTKLK